MPAYQPTAPARPWPVLPVAVQPQNMCSAQVMLQQACLTHHVSPAHPRRSAPHPCHAPGALRANERRRGARGAGPRRVPLCHWPPAAGCRVSRTSAHTLPRACPACAASCRWAPAPHMTCTPRSLAPRPPWGARPGCRSTWGGWGGGRGAAAAGEGSEGACRARAGRAGHSQRVR